jgi:hypothetical protein
MRFRQGSWARPRGWWLAGLFLWWWSTSVVLAANITLELRLIWCTDDPKYSDPKHKKVDEATVAKFRKVPFGWKNYYEVNKVTGMVLSRSTNSFKMSDKCTIVIKELEGPKVEVTLIGEGKEVVKATKQLMKGELTTIGGEDKTKTGCAWFVVISQVDEK